ncbi:MAG: MFS transporter [SAR202 cluster bacterium]|nr:MFS transporter [SAR202 cluster bacterium]|tara:strand:+ start:50792 stop:51970 length:1179 start_codon:yes stop_codon:yes gene_type:complete
MRQNRFLIQLSTADFILRAGYQVGKSPLLPLFATSLGANEIFIGYILSISTLTGMITKPIFGFWSDKLGEKKFLFASLIIFIITPFSYYLINKPIHLLVIRIIHGFGTAIFGPVTMSIIATIFSDNRASKYGIFSIARNSSYIVAPIIAGILMNQIGFKQIYYLIGIISLFALIPIIQLNNDHKKWIITNKISKNIHSKIAIISTLKNPSIILGGLINSSMFISTYAIKAFLPIQLDEIGFNIIFIGFLFGLQEISNLILNPILGKISDKIGHLNGVILGLILIATGVYLLTLEKNYTLLIFISLILGGGQAFITPSLTALVANKINSHMMGTGMGTFGAIKNLGKVVGPIIGGNLQSRVGFIGSFRILSVFTAIIAIFILITKHYITKNKN